MLTTKDIIKEGNPTLRQVAELVPLPASEEDQTNFSKFNGVCTK